MTWLPERKGRCRLLTLPGTSAPGLGEPEAEHGPLLALAGELDLAHQDLPRGSWAAGLVLTTTVTGTGGWPPGCGRDAG